MLLICILSPFILTLFLPLIKRMIGLHPGWVVLPLPALLFAAFISRMEEVRSGETVMEHLRWMPSFGVDIALKLDGLSLLFALIITGMGTLVVLYSIFYMKKRTDSLHAFYVYLLLFMGAMLGVVLSDNMMVLYGFWELTSISSFLLIAFWHKRERSRYGALKSMLITVFGGLAMFAGFLMLYSMTGTFSISDTVGQVAQISNHAFFIPAMVLILLGAFTKSAQFPFHIWLPDAMEAPTPVSAYLHSATMVKAGLYLVARMSPVFAGHSEWFWIVSLTGFVTLAYGSVKAIGQTDLKALLAYSTISQLGLMMGLLGLGSAAAFAAPAESVVYAAATTAALFHLVNHAVFKGTLFMAVGIIDHETHTRDLRNLGGLLTLMPITFTVTLAGAFSMAGLPPFGGFLSKEMFFTAALDIRHLAELGLPAILAGFAVVAWLASVCTFIYSMILLLKPFGGKLQRQLLDKIPQEASVGLLIPPVILAGLTLVFGFFPGLVSHTLIEPAMKAVHTGLLSEGQAFAVSIRFWHGWTPEVFMTIGVIAVGTVIVGLLHFFKPERKESPGRMTLSRVYDGTLQLLERGGERLTDTYMTGSRRRYLQYIFVFIIIALTGALIGGKDIAFGMETYAPVSIYEIVVIGSMLIAACAVPFARSRVSAILFTGAVGYMVTLLFVLLRAPDLALTQIIVESVSVILFLLCFHYLPKLKKEAVARRVHLPNLFISLGVGAVMTLVALAAMGSSPFPAIADFFLEESYRSAGGKNVVNVILVDFRGFDTLFEITVLGIASLAIFSMIKLQLEPKREGPRMLSTPVVPRGAGATNEVILKTISRVAVVVMIIFSFYLFFAGHNGPGGGFIGALLTSASLVLLAIAFGMDTFRNVLPLNYRLVTAVGLLIAIAVSAGSFLFGAPFLSHAFGHQQLPILGDTELATAVLFDLGVYLSVVGVTMTIILTIGEDR